MKSLIIVGTGETAQLAYEYFTHDSDYDVIAFSIQDCYCHTDSFLNKPLIPLSQLTQYYPPNKYDAFVAISATQLNHLRARLFDEIKSLGYVLVTYISSKAFVWHNVHIGKNCFILEHNTIQPFVQIGDNVTLWSGNHIGHRTVIEDHVFVSSHVVVSGFCRVGHHSNLNVNVSLADQITLGSENFIAMNTCINKNTPDNVVVSGHPMTIRKVLAKQFCRVE